MSEKNIPLTNYIDTSIKDDEVIRLDHVSVQYRIPQEQIGTFREFFIRLLQRRVHFRNFYALEDVSLDVKRGEVFGLIGNNGAGKSTMLKVIARVLRPQKGRVQVRGKVSPLLELGAGFHPELTGRENIYLNGAILGYSHEEMDDIFANIIEFSELGDFIDVPIRTYSTGMNARLGFAVATAHKPEVLIVDEILGVGDEAFQKKCFNRIKQYQDDGTSIMLVSHSMETILRMCQRVAWLQHGTIMAQGDPREVIEKYREGRNC